MLKVGRLKDKYLGKACIVYTEGNRETVFEEKPRVTGLSS